MIYDVDKCVMKCHPVSNITTSFMEKVIRNQFGMISTSDSCHLHRYNDHLL